MGDKIVDKLDLEIVECNLYDDQEDLYFGAPPPPPCPCCCCCTCTTTTTT